jgi:hypothetical protein
VIPFLLILGALYLLSAPDPVTAGARAAAGTGARAAASGFGQHWADGRKYRDGRRTARRERWDGRVNGAKPHPWLLRADRAITWLLGADRTAAGITAAAARPVPAAMRGGWSRGWERHRAKAGNRPVPVALDLPRWRREQAQVQAGNRPQVQPAEQVQADVRRARGPGWWNRPDKSTSAASTPSGAPEPIEPKEQSPVLAWQEIPFETVDDAEGTGGLDTEEQIRSRRSPTWNRLFPEPLTEADRRFWTERDGPPQPGRPTPARGLDPAQTGRYRVTSER